MIQKKTMLEQQEEQYAENKMGTMPVQTVNHDVSAIDDFYVGTKVHCIIL